MGLWRVIWIFHLFNSWVFQNRLVGENVDVFKQEQQEGAVMVKW
jgi:hypothetical protein